MRIWSAPAPVAFFTAALAFAPPARAGRSLPDPFASVERLGDDVLQILRPTETSAKLGPDGDLLAWERDGVLFTVRPLLPDVPIEVYPPTERAQLFTRHDCRDDSPELPPGTSYIELELTGPRQSLSPGERASLSTVWELVRLSEDERSPVDVASRLRAR